MKATTIYKLIAGIFITTIIACSDSPTGPTDITSDVQKITIAPTETSTTESIQISALEASGIAFMREEEKLARDVYVLLYNTWGTAIFQNISGSEQQHMDAVKTILDQYSIADPAASNDMGVFSDTTLQDLYNTLAQQGLVSVGDALKVGAIIEEVDILDLEERIAATDKADIIQVYDSLLRGSRNHLRSFVQTLKAQTGETYTPQYLKTADYENIINSTTERGRPW